MILTRTTTAVASAPDPAQDHSAAILPDNIVVLVHAVRILLDYGRHLIDTIRCRSTAPNFNAIAACFGTDNIATILAHLNRGILRCIALERLLLARAATGRDIDYVERPRTMEPQPIAADMGAAQSPAAGPARRQRVLRPIGWNDPELFMPALEDLERRMRRRPVGRIFLDICLDLAVVPGFCHSAFWNELFDIMNRFGGGGAVDQLMRQKTRRREAFADQQDRRRDSNWEWLNMTREALRQALGFFIGEPPINPLDPAAAIAITPP